MQVLIYQRAYPRIAAELASRVPSAEPLLMADDGSLQLRGRTTSPEEVEPVVAWANTDLYVGGPVREFMVACLKSASLRFVQSSAAGFEHPVFSLLVDKGIVLANSNASAIAIAEFVMARVLDELQPNTRRRALQVERRWQRTPFREVHGQTWLVVGLGNIGREVVTRAQAFGAQVIGARRRPTGDEPCARTVGLGQLDEVLPACDVVVLAAPSNPESHRVIDAARLLRFKPGSLLGNIARGSLVDEAALVQALERGAPSCAILDVFESEPLPQASPLWSHPAVRLSAHNAAAGDGFVTRNDALFLHNLARFAAGEAPEHVVSAATVKASQVKGA
jgi:phosphoglycerate dehydrogenase-like enzyme